MKKLVMVFGLLLVLVTLASCADTTSSTIKTYDYPQTTDDSQDTQSGSTQTSVIVIDDIL